MGDPSRPPPRNRTASPGRAVVIGAGIGGLAAAIRLLAAGHDVTVVESLATPGGRAGQIRDRGFTFDTGPSLITMPRVLEDLFRVARTSLAGRLQLTRLDPFFEIHWEGDSRTFPFNGERAAMMSGIAQFSGRDSAAYDRFLESSRRIYQYAIVEAGARPSMHVADLLVLLPKLLRLHGLRSVEGFVGRFFSHPQVREAFAFHSLYIGGDPQRVPAIYATLAYLQIAEGVWYTPGGFYRLVEALVGLVRELGGEITYGDPVVRIVCEGGRARGVITASGRTHRADVVISNADVSTTQRMLAPRPRVRSPRPTMSCFLLYLGTNRRFPQLRHHTLLFGRGLSHFIAAVTRDGEVPSSTTLYLHTPSRTDPSMAPPGCESITALLPVPNLRSGHDWNQIGDEIRDRVIATLESAEGLHLSGLRESIVVEHRRTPLDFQQLFGARYGNAFAAEPTFLQSAYFRQHNRDRRVGGLYYAGGGTHPGAGVPGVLLTAQVTAGLIGSDGL